MSDEHLKVPELSPGVYVHYKSDDMKYEVIGVALHSETLQPLVVYRPLHKSDVQYWVRPYDMFVETVEVNGERVPRFRKA